MQALQILGNTFSTIDEKEWLATFKQYMYQNRIRSVISYQQLEMLKKIQLQAAEELDKVIVDTLKEKQSDVLHGVEEIIAKYDRVYTTLVDTNPAHITMRDLENEIRDKIKTNMISINNDIIDVMFVWTWDYRLIGDASTKRIRINNCQIYWQSGHIHINITFRDWRRYDESVPY